ncbi:MAG TPA: hypothetical protein PKY82_14210 [Pyrinomonadaceae bacterium]|nr:hypothetical protein [Pyrinomonadaceae bacterium]
MKNKTFSLLMLSLLFLALTGVSAFAQNKLFQQPKRLLLLGDTLEETNENPRLMKEYFYPLGWSKDGKFAYYLEPPDEACGCYFGEIYIVDLKTDKILWSKKYEGQMDKPEDLKSTWKKFQKLFSQKLNQYGIVAAKNFTLLGENFEANGDSFKIDYFADVNLDEDPYNSKGSIAVKMVSATKGKKTLYQKTFKGENNAGILASSLGGVLKSPFESRVAVIRVDTQRGWEGPPHVTKISVVGADLNKGFK